jgi:hypothetical protein
MASLSTVLAPVACACRRAVAPLGAALFLAAAAGPLAGVADTDAAVAAGGLRLVGNARVAVREGRLRVGLKRVSVEYVFVNETSAPISAEVSFPAPDYRWAFDGYHAFSDVAVSVNGVPVTVQPDVKAFAGRPPGEKDVTAALRANGVDVERFGGMDDAAEVSEVGQVLETRNQLVSLPPAAKTQLRALGAIDDGDDPAWKVRMLYRWTQRFPPGRPVRVTLSYAPAPGVETEPDLKKLLDRACAGAALRARRSREVWWVEYLLATDAGAGPIGKLELTVDVPKRATASFCWDGRVEAGPDGTLRATAANLLPKRALTVYYFYE